VWDGAATLKTRSGGRDAADGGPHMWRAFVSADDADHLEWSGRASECYARSRVWVPGEQMVNPLRAAAV